MANAKIEPYPLPDIESLRKFSEDDFLKLKKRAKDYYDEESGGVPLLWYKHDTNAHNDDDLQDLIALRGLEGYGAYFLLIEHLCTRINHSYDVSRPSGWLQIQRDLMLPTLEETRSLIEQFVELRLLDSYAFERGLINNERISAQVEKSRAKYSQQCFAGWCNKLSRLVEGL